MEKLQSMEQFEQLKGGEPLLQKTTILQQLS